MTAQQDHHDRPTASPSPQRVAVISASVREGRMGSAVADWVVATARQAGGIEVDLIDLVDVALPEDKLLYPGGGPRSEVADRIEAAEAYVFVMPEYNHSYPASLKRLIDWHYGEWMFKPATIVAYGVQGGHAAIEHLRGVLAELSVVTTRRVMGLRAPWEALDDAGAYAPDDGAAKGLTGALAELGWWADVLTDARANRPFRDG